jgi:hypothetical protein
MSTDLEATGCQGQSEYKLRALGVWFWDCIVQFCSLAMQIFLV